MKKKITIVDYGSGNLLSAKQSFVKAANLQNTNAEIQISSDPLSLIKSSHVVLPGQGAFKTCMDGIQKIPGMKDQLNEFVKIKKRPFFGICVGMQLLADTSEENGTHHGFGWISGKIKKLPSIKIKMPHMGWNKIKVVNNNPLIKPEETDYYFVHSYYFDCLNKKDIVAETNYGINFPSIVNKENVYGCQFHPEKSSIQGLKIIKDFINL
ncbi:imidazole glycerol phosphate synthase subunit HisH [Pelagibacteraceae bacterium]|nr:imidazole glycerol phosphate synthase subunit HisH [Pelagibacteraceae bacterium]